MGLLDRLRRTGGELAAAGVWARAYADCASIARRRPELETLLPAVRALSEEAQARWPTDTLDVPAAAEARAAQRRLADVRKAFAEAEYRARLLQVDPSDSAQLDRFHQALAAASRLLER